MNKRFAIAMSIYVVLALIAVVVLKDQIRLAVLILLGGLAVKTLIARAARW